MVDESEGGVGQSGAQAAALGMAMNEAARDASVAEEARDFLRKQTELLHVQKSVLEEEAKLNISHLRFRRFSDYARFAMEVAGFFVVLLIVCGLATMVWNASQDRDLVVDAFSVPADVAQSGMTGSVLAGRVLDRFGTMQSQTFAFSQGAASYRGDAANEVRVEIPSTGISLGELNRYLREWLGHEVHVSGDLVHAGRGYALTTRYGAEPGATVTGKEGGLDGLVNKSAEQIFDAAQPYRYVEYLVQEQRFAEISALLPSLAGRGSAKDRALANEDWAKLYFYQGDMPRALEKGREAVRLDPDSPLAHGWLGAAEDNIGHDESAYANAAAAVRLFNESSGADEAVLLRFRFVAFRDECTGDFADAVHTLVQLANAESLLDANSAENASEHAALNHDLPHARWFAAMIEARDSRGRPQAERPIASFYIHFAKGDWASAVKDSAVASAILNSQKDHQWYELGLAPDFADATARTGDFKTADKIVADLPPDCDICMRGRGKVAAIEGRWTEAARDFALVAARSPHTPFAETDWGQMLLQEGKYDEAAEKFREANLKGPHFADPLEMWGEALMQKNCSDLALTKFEGADKYAPNWGRLHLKWGEALYYVGRKDDAKRQFNTASNLDLSPPDKIALLKWMTPHE